MWLKGFLLTLALMFMLGFSQGCGPQEPVGEPGAPEEYEEPAPEEYGPPEDEGYREPGQEPEPGF